jgi:hypothetical protein
MTFTFNTGVPAANNDPSVDQPDMLQNNVSNADIWDVDHIGFNASNGGTHEKITFISTVSPSAPTGLGSVIYSSAGVADTSNAQLKFQNVDTTFVVTCLRAWAFCGTSGIINSQSMNVTSVTRVSAGIYDVVLSANTVLTNSFGILVSSTALSSSTSVSTAYSITGVGTFTLNFRAPATGTLQDPTSFTFQVLQV